MRLDTSQQMRTEMRLRMAPRMIQSMEILQLPIMALAGADRAGAERESGAGGPPGVGPTPPRTDDDEDRTAPGRRAGGRDAETNEFDSLIRLDENWSELYDEGPRRSRASLSEEGDRKQDAMQNMASRPRSFHDDLTEQLGFFDCDPTVRDAGRVHHLQPRRQRLSPST